MPIDEEMVRRVIREELERYVVVVEAVKKALAKLDRQRLDPNLSTKRRAASQARWGTSVPGSRAARLAVAQKHGTHTEKEWIGLLELLDYRCAVCGREGVVKDHIIPIRFLESSDAIENLQPMCRPCNTGKGRDQRDLRPPDWRGRLDEWLKANESKTIEKVVEGSVVYVRGAVKLPKANASKISAKKAAPAEALSTGLSTAEAPLADVTTEQTPGTRAFLSYAAAYQMRYGEFPVRNAKTNALLKQLVGRLGDGEAGGVAEYYLSLSDRLYAGSGHCLSLLVRDAEKLRTMWKQGAAASPGAPAAPAKPWWEVWSGLEQQGDDLGIDRDDNPQTYRGTVLRAAYKAGRLPEEVAVKLGLRVDG